jgi:hypothetical protein
MTCKYCHNFTGEDDFTVRGKIRDLYQSATDGCTTCQLARQATRELLQDQTTSDSEYIIWTSRLADRADVVQPEGSEQWGLSLRVETGNEFFDVSFYTIADAPNPWNKVPVEEHVPTTTNSQDSYLFATSNLSWCVDGHEACRSSASDFVPTRLLAVGAEGDTSVRVVEARWLSVDKYLALSHCWGPPETITTRLTQATYDRYTTDIPLSELPKTFHDAVNCTRALGCEYIWIDSLCIIQNNKEDWLREAATMCQVYENALLTLAAASSSNGSGGLFYRPRRVELSGYDMSIGAPYSIFARLEIDHHYFHLPLTKRAWVMQERLLAPRTLYFTDQELVWECRQENSCQCTPLGGGGFTEQEADFPRALKFPPSMEGLSPQWAWHDVVGIYSRLDMTKPGDKLIAIDGVAQFMKRTRESRYWAGLWEDSFISDLLWTVAVGDSWSTRPLRPTDWRAPTWSWASVDRQVAYQEMVEQSGRAPKLEVVRWPRDPDSGFSAWKAPGPGSRVTLRGVVVETTVGAADMVVGTSPCLRADTEEWQPSPGHTKASEPLFCLRMMQGELGLMSLALRRVSSGGTGLYERFGVLVYEGEVDEEVRYLDMSTRRGTWVVKGGFPVWWKDGEVKEVTIV